MPTRNGVAWNAMILGYVRSGRGGEALELSRQMKLKGVEPNSVAFVGMLNACASEVNLEEGKLVHKEIIRKGFESHVFVESSLINMYVKCGSIEDACIVFGKIPKCNMVAGSTWIFGHVRCGQALKGLQLYHQMQREGVDPNPFTFVGVLNACATIPAFVGHSLIDMYGKCGSISDAQRVFDKLLIRKALAWNALVQGYGRCGQGGKVLELYRCMQLERIDLYPHTFIRVINACASAAAFEEGKSIHAKIIERRWESDVYMPLGFGVVTGLPFFA